MKFEKPLSPHITIYNGQLTSVLSIIHRVVGIIIFSSVVALFFVTKVTMLNIDNYYLYYIVQFFNNLNNPITLSFLFFLLFSVIYYGLNGVRHLMWDTANGFTIEEIYSSGKIVLAASIILSILIWFIVIN